MNHIRVKELNNLSIVSEYTDAIYVSKFILYFPTLNKIQFKMGWQLNQYFVSFINFLRPNLIINNRNTSLYRGTNDLLNDFSRKPFDVQPFILLNQNDFTNEQDFIIYNDARIKYNEYQRQNIPIPFMDF